MTKTKDANAQAEKDSAVKTNTPETVPVSSANRGKKVETDPAMAAEEVGGPKGPEPTRYGDWEKKGRCIDF